MNAAEVQFLEHDLNLSSLEDDLKHDARFPMPMPMLPKLLLEYLNVSYVAMCAKLPFLIHHNPKGARDTDFRNRDEHARVLPGAPADTVARLQNIYQEQAGLLPCYDGYMLVFGGMILNPSETTAAEVGITPEVTFACCKASAIEVVELDVSDDGGTVMLLSDDDGDANSEIEIVAETVRPRKRHARTAADAEICYSCC
ncbi:hypothetical protein GGF31_007297 [Allomyces arbusculus]|nr:hypothetical protein GGF31_007297 [Allomyces arbusculus]